MPPILLGDTNIFIPPPLPSIPPSLSITHYRGTYQLMDTHLKHTPSSPPYLGFMTIPVRVFPFD